MAIVIFVPVPQLKAFQKIQVRLVRELEKKFAGKHVVFIAQRKILAKPTRKANKLKQKRPRSRTLVAVHNAVLDDMVYPAEIVGKRTRIRLDGSRLFKVHLDKIQQTSIEHKTETFASVSMGQGFSKSTWTRSNRPALNTRPNLRLRIQEVDWKGSDLRIPRANLLNLLCAFCYDKI